MSLDAEHGADADPPRSPDPGDHGADVADAPMDDDHDGSSRPPARRRGAASAGLLGAAMLAVGEVLEPEKTRVEIVQTDDEPLDELPFGIDFGDLPPLD